MLTYGPFEARLWNAAMGAPIGSALQHNDSITSAQFSPDGKRVLTSSLDDRARIWNALTGAPIACEFRHDADVSHAIFSADGLRIATSSNDGKARVWKASTCEPVTPWLRHGDSVGNIAFVKSGSQLLTVASDGAHLWRVDLPIITGNRISHRDGDPISGYRFRPGKKQVLTWGSWSEDGSINLWNLESGERAFPEALLSSYLLDAAFSEDGAVIHAVALDGAYIALRSDDGKTLTIKPLRTGNLQIAQFSPDRQRLVTVSESELVVWSTTPFLNILREPLALAQFNSKVVFSPDSRHFGLLFDDKRVVIRDGRTGIQERVLEHDPARYVPEDFSVVKVVAAVFDPGGEVLLTGLNDGSVRAWTIKNGEERFLPIQLGDNAASIEFRPGGAEFLISTESGETHVYNANSGKPVGQPIARRSELTSISASGVFAAKYSPDGTKIVAASLWDRSVLVCDADSLAAMTPALGHEDFVLSAGFSPDGSRILTESAASIRLWDAETGTSLSPILERSTHGVLSAFSPDGTAFIAATDGGLTLHSLPPTGRYLVAEAEERLSRLSLSAEQCQQFSLSCED